MSQTDDRMIVLSAADGVAVARCVIPAGTNLVLGGVQVTLTQAVTMGHKLAIRSMVPGEKVLKYGVSIGSATQAIAVGDHVHLHNMKSDYTPTYALDAAEEEYAP